MSETEMTEAQVVTSSGRTIAYAIHGDAHLPPMLFVHASGLSSTEWRKAAARLQSRVRVVVPDLLGYGRSDPLPMGTPATSRDDREALTAILRAVGPAHVVGHSYGGYLSMKLALSAPELVRSLVLIEPVLFGALRQSGDKESAKEIALLYDDPRFLHDSFGGMEQWMEQFIDYWGGIGAWAKMPAPNRQANMRVAWKVFCEVNDLSRDPAAFAEYRAIGGRVMLVRGSLTTVCARRIIDLVSAEIAGASIRVVEGAGHMSPLTHSNEVLGLVEEHLLRVV